jgi:hypothetical protein
MSLSQETRNMIIYHEHLFSHAEIMEGVMEVQLDPINVGITLS